MNGFIFKDKFRNESILYILNFMSENNVKIIKYKCSNCGREETREYPKQSKPEITILCPECHFLTFTQVKYDYFQNGPKSS
jgi:DNA-directed RNA polymerase subunit RPC12/RpoP